MSRHRFLAWLAVPFVLYLVPLLLGFSWNALGGPNPLNPPLPPTEGYVGRSSDLPITAEAWGASVVNLPFRARLRDYVGHGELPLWNPYQGLGQPFAAQGEGSPYSPISIARELVPYSLGNYVTFLVYYVAAVCFFLFLRDVGLSELAAVFGGAVYAISGALSVHIARVNIADQLCMVPVLFWSATRAMRTRSIRGYAMLCGAAALNTLAGFIQIAMLAGIVLVIFCATYIWVTRASRAQRVREFLMILGAFVLGNGLVAFELLPMLYAFRTAFTKNGPSIYLAPLPLANLVAFFFPTMFGHPLKGSWIPGPTFRTVDWSNLFAYSGITLLLLSVVGFTSIHRQCRVHRALFLCFVGTGVFLTLRYLSAAPFDVVNLLPVLGMQTPKHATGIIVFCLTIAAAIAVHYVRQWNANQGGWLILGTLSFFFLTLVHLLAPEIVAGSSALAPMATRYSLTFLSVTVVVTLVVVAMLRIANTRMRLSARHAAALVVATAVAELSLYVPLGTSALAFLYARLAVTILVAVAGLAFALERRAIGACLCGLALAGYVWVVAAPTSGLPRQFEADRLPPFMGWLKVAAGGEYRTFGIFPDFSSLGKVQDLSVVGPLAPRSFLNMIRIVGTESVTHVYETSTEFMLAGRRDFPFQQYAKMKPIFDWLGVRYLVLDHAYFNPRTRTDHQNLLDDSRNFRVAYKDHRVTILESLNARPKATFSANVSVYPNEAAIIARLRTHPETVFGPLMIESGRKWPGEQIQPQQLQAGFARVDYYTPNQVQISVDAPGPGVIVLKDSDDPGWSATVDSIPTPVFRVNGMVRGVAITRAGHHIVRMKYRPPGFGQGITLAALTGLLIGVALIVDSPTGGHRTPNWILALAGLLATITAVAILYVELGLLAGV